MRLRRHDVVRGHLEWPVEETREGAKQTEHVRCVPVRARDRSAPRDRAGPAGELSRSLDSMAENLVSRKELQAYIDQMSTLSAKLDLHGRVVMANRAGFQAFGRPEAEIIGRSFLGEPWYPCDPAVGERVRRAFAEARTGKTVSREETFLGGEGMRVHLSITFSPVRDAFGAVAYIIAEGRDVTALKDAQAALYEVNEGLEESVRERTESLQDALREKEMLLKEIHHRVKNNLQIISSLLSLQSVHVRDPEVAGILTESRNRVKSMALVHERLYAGDDLGSSGFTGYIRDLAAQLVRSSETAKPQRPAGVRPGGDTRGPQPGDPLRAGHP